MHVRLIDMVLAYIVLFIAMLTATDTQVQLDTCTLGDHIYRVGQSWHPKLLPFGENPCVNCTCVKGGDVKCTGVDCPKPECQEPRIVHGQCCPTCDVKIEDVRKDPGEQPGCDFHGTHYANEDVFPSNKTALKPKHDNQCVLCVCYRGDVICHLKTCLTSPRCRKTMKVDDDCCLQCKEPSSLEDFTRLIANNWNQTIDEGDCWPATGRQRNGSTWKPVIGQYGEMKCVVCTCMNGQINCSRLQCPEESNVRCNGSDPNPSGCCKQCATDHQKHRTKTSGEGRRCRQGAGDGKMKKSCLNKKKMSRNKRNRKKNGQGKNKKVFLGEQRLSEVLHRLCIPVKAPHLVYHSKAKDHEIVAFDLRSESKIEYVYWTVKKGKLQNMERKYSTEASEYRRNVTVAEIMGSVEKNDIRRFFKRLERKHLCQKKCKRKILDKAIKKLKVQEIDLTRSCNS